MREFRLDRLHLSRSEILDIEAIGDPEPYDFGDESYGYEIPVKVDVFCTFKFYTGNFSNSISFEKLGSYEDWVIISVYADAFDDLEEFEEFTLSTDAERLAYVSKNAGRLINDTPELQNWILNISPSRNYEDLIFKLKDQVYEENKHRFEKIAEGIL